MTPSRNIHSGRWRAKLAALAGVLTVGFAAAVAGGNTARAADGADVVALSPYTFIEERRGRATQLLRRAPSPQGYRSERPPAGVRRVTYTSDGRELWGWLAMPADTGRPVPGIVYAHGGYAFGAGDFAVA